MPLMNFTKGEIGALKLRLVAFATDSGTLIAGLTSAISRLYLRAKADEPEQLFQNFTLGEIR